MSEITGSGFRLAKYGDEPAVADAVIFSRSAKDCSISRAGTQEARFGQAQMGSAEKGHPARRMHAGRSLHPVARLLHWMVANRE
jgi:hypothetical protein